MEFGRWNLVAVDAGNGIGRGEIVEQVFDRCNGNLGKSIVDAILNFLVLLGFGGLGVEGLVYCNVDASPTGSDVGSAISGDS